MMHKHLTLKAHCAGCLEIVFKQVYVVKIKTLESFKKAHPTILKQFPETITCTACNSNQVLRSYAFMHEHQFTKEDAVKRKQDIDRCKAQIAATMDYNNDISPADRPILCEAFQKQLASLLAPNNILSNRP